MDEFLDGGRLPEGVEDDPAPEREVGAAPTCGDERSVCDVDVAEPAAVLLDGAHHDRGEHTSVEDGQDDVAPPCQQTCGAPADETDVLVLACGEAGHEAVRGGGKPQCAAACGMDDGRGFAVCAGLGYECENVRRGGQFLHE